MSVKLHLSIVGQADPPKLHTSARGGHFAAPLKRLEWIDGKDYLILGGNRYYLTDDEGGEFIDMPDPFRTNFASTPRIAWAIFPPTGSYALAAGFHDKLFLAPVIRSAHSARPCTLEEANHLFLEMAEACGTSLVVRRTMYRFLQLGSQASWDRYRAADRLTGSTTTLVTATPNELLAFHALKVAARMDRAA